MSCQLILARTGVAKIASRVAWCFLLNSTQYHILVSFQGLLIGFSRDNALLREADIIADAPEKTRTARDAAFIWMTFKTRDGQLIL